MKTFGKICAFLLVAVLAFGGTLGIGRAVTGSWDIRDWGKQEQTLPDEQSDDDDNTETPTEQPTEPEQPAEPEPSTKTASEGLDIYSCVLQGIGTCTDTDIVVPNGIYIIDDYAFQDCKNVTSIELPSIIEGIGVYAFSNCENLSTIKYNGTAEQWNAITKKPFYSRGIKSGCQVIDKDGNVIATLGV